MAKKTKTIVQRDLEIYEITSIAAGDFSLQEVLDKLTKAAVEITATKACCIRLLDDEAGNLKMRSTFGLSEEYRNKGKVSKDDPVIKAAFTGEAVVLDDMRVDSRVQFPDATKKEGLVSQLTVAMSFKNKPIGVLRLYSPEAKRFDEDDIILARLVASQCAVAITNARLYTRAIEGAKIAEQMRLAAVVQRRMIPKKAPSMPNLEIASVYQPCFEVGGDLYDFIQTGPNTLAVIIADVIGKGIAAAMMMSLFRGAITAHADGGFGRHPLSEIVTRLNRIACRECRDGEFITLFIASIDTEKMQITYCNCGLEPALLLRKAKVAELDKGGLVLGITPDAEYQIQTLPLKKQDAILMYTDGLIDAIDFEGRLWGKERMLQALHQCPHYAPDCMIKNMLTYRRRFVGLASQLDDTSVVAIKIKEDAPEKKS